MNKDTTLLIPFVYKSIILPEWMFVIFLFLAVIGTVNGVNFTDGLDGLASGITSIVATFFSVAAFTIHPGYTPITFAVLGSLLGFLLFNVHPARIFMGDTGSLALGGFGVSIGFMLQIPLYIVVVGMIYLIEVLSVILQVGCYKITHGKRILKMAPLHHHLELMGIPETQIVVAFCMITALLCILGMVV